MNRNDWVDMWLVLSRGQRRVIILLACIIVILCIARIAVSVQRTNSVEPSTDYSVLEQEIATFRSQLDTVPLDERRPLYIRRAEAEDSVAQQQYEEKLQEQINKEQNPSEHQLFTPIERIERIERKSK